MREFCHAPRSSSEHLTNESTAWSTEFPKKLPSLDYSGGPLTVGSRPPPRDEEQKRAVVDRRSSFIELCLGLNRHKVI